MKNMELYDRVKSVPQDAQRTIEAGRLKGMTDINPMWRIEVLTREFGACGKGWKVEDVVFSETDYTEESVMKCELKLYYFDKDFGDWSAPVFGVGAAKSRAKEKNGIYIDDEAIKKAYTDALSVACKALGIGAEIYRYGKSSTGSKYERKEQPTEKAKKEEAPKPVKEEKIQTEPQVWEKPFTFNQADIYELSRRLGKTIESTEMYSMEKYGTNIAALKREQIEELGEMLWAVAEKNGRV